MIANANQLTEVERLAKRAERERAARKEAERQLEEKSSQLFESHEQLKHAFAQVRESADRTRAILESMPNGVFVTARDNTILDVNAMACQKFGLTTSSEIGRLLAEFLPFIENLSASKKEELFSSHLPYVSTARTKDNVEIPCEITATRIDADQVVWMVRDISARVEAEMRQRKLEAELQQSQKFESLGTMAGGIAHELNTPIQFVTDNTRFLQKAFTDLVAAVQDLKVCVTPDVAKRVVDKFDLEYLDAEVPQAITQSIDGLERIAEIVLAIKRFSHPASATKEANDLNQIIHTTVLVTKNQWKYVAELNLELAPNLPPIMSNAGELTQVILNLIVNATHAIEDRKYAGKLGKIVISTHAIENGVECRIQDNGSGIEPANLKRIFDLFFTTKTPGRGTGQGLALAHSIICNSHGGNIDVESQLGEGSTFILRLPLDGTGASWQSK